MTTDQTTTDQTTTGQTTTGQTTTDHVAHYQRSLMNTFGPPKLTLTRGAGAHVWDVEGREYVDLLGGIAVNALGHAHPALVEAVTRQLSRLGHISNLFTSEAQIALAERLLDLLDPGGGTATGKVFLTNSGTEAVEAAFKLSRRTGRTHVVAAEGGFHGRTMGALALTSKAAYREPFEPLPGDVTFVPYGDRAALAEAVSDRTAAILLEPIQGEAGVVVPPEGYLAAARQLADDHGALLWLDEIQSGLGRTGRWFEHHRSGITPDVVTVAKGLGGGFPIGACIGLGGAGDLLQPGNHGSTFGGNPVACAAALAVIGTIEAENLLDHVTVLGQKLRDGLAADPRVTEVRGEGLLIGLDLAADASADVAAAALAAGFIVNNPTPHRIRLAPPLVLTDDDAAAFLEAWPGILDSAGAPVTRHFLADDDLSPAEQAEVLDLAAKLKAAPYDVRPYAGPQSVAMIFDKPTLRTQVSFAAGIAELGGSPMLVEGRLAGIGVRESVEDVARVLGRQVSTIVWRTFLQSDLERMAQYAGVPVVNALTDDFHPCQLVADLLTVLEHRGRLAGLTVAFVGDAACNMGNSWLLAGATAGMHVRVSGPPGYWPDEAMFRRAAAIGADTGGSATGYVDPVAAVTDADVVVTDTWVSMGKEAEEAARAQVLAPYSLTSELLAHAAPDAVVLHCLPAYRGKEIAAEVIDGPRSVVWDEAENRRHAQKAVLAWLMGQSDGRADGA